jgi:3-hydroxybutyryl-CoA dehydrogenase
MDLIGHDTNFAVTETVYAANFGDKRYAPSLVQRELVDGGLLGRKTGRGFFDYGKDALQGAAPQGAAAPAPPPAGMVVLHGHGLAVERWAAALDHAGRTYARDAQSGWSGLSADSAQLRLTDGRPAGMVAAREQVRELVLFDLALPISGLAPFALAWCAATTASEAWLDQAVHWLQVAGWQPRQMADAAGLVVARTLAMLINEASDAVMQWVCTAEAADAAMKLGVNYPAGPFEWLAAWDARAVVRLLDHLDGHYRGERYRVSPALRQRAWALQSHS